jgi:transposase
MPRPGPRTTNKYSDRFKATAVRLSELPGVEVQCNPLTARTTWK